MSKLNNNPQFDNEALTKEKLKKPSLYKVIMLNDDYTPMDFVVYLLKNFFNKNHDEASKIMLEVHNNGAGVCGVFTYEIAETKILKVVNTSRTNGFPLLCTLIFCPRRIAYIGDIFNIITLFINNIIIKYTIYILYTFRIEYI